MPSMEPLTRQQGLVFEQSELLREQFLRFGEALQRVHGMVERLREDLDLERQQRLSGEEQASTTIIALRVDLNGALNGERRKTEVLLKQVDERLISVREEVVLRARASDGELQRLGGKVDGLATDISAQVAGLLEKQRIFGEELQADMQSVLGEEHSWCETALKNMHSELLEKSAGKSQLQDEMQQRVQAVLRLEKRIEEECLGTLRAESGHWQASLEMGRQERDALESSLSAVRQTLTGVLEASQGQALTFETLTRRVGENHEQCLKTLREEEMRRLVAEEALRTSTSESTMIVAQGLSNVETALSDRVAGLEADSTCETESFMSRIAALNAAQEQLSAEMGSERQQRSVNTLGLVTEVNEMRFEVAREAESQRSAAALLDDYTRQTSSLQQLVHEEQSAQAALSDAFAQHNSELQEQSRSMQAAISDGMRAATDSSKLGREELWHVLGSLQEDVQERNALSTHELQELDLRTKRIEVHRLAELSQQLDEVAALSGDVSTKVYTLEECSLKEHAALASRLDHCTYDLERTTEMLNGLVASATHDFIESPDNQFRLYVTPDGDVAVFQRNNWGKYADSEFQGVPCWHAGCQRTVSDRPLCSVNREMQAHEKDRFLVLANRAAAPQ